MNRLLLLFIFFIGSGIVAPRMIPEQMQNLDAEMLKCLKIEAYQLLENPVESLLIQKIVSSEYNGPMIRMEAYTFWGIRYALIEVQCNGPSRVVWRRWFN